jgi:hypothetical protein
MNGSGLAAAVNNSNNGEPVNLNVQPNRWIRTKEGKWVKSSGEDGPVVTSGRPNSQELCQSIGSEYSAGLDYFNNSGVKPNMNLLD